MPNNEICEDKLMRLIFTCNQTPLLFLRIPVLIVVENNVKVFKLVASL